MFQKPSLILCLLFLTAIPSFAQGRIEFDVSGWDWHVEGLIPGRGMQEGFHTFPPGHAGSPFLWTPAKVPGDVYTDLWRAGQIEDPYFGRNLEKLRWVMDKEWWYTKQFNLPKEMRGKNLSLQFDGVDYQCEVWFNGTRLGAHEGMFSGFSFDVKNSGKGIYFFSFFLYSFAHIPLSSFETGHT